jgi:hypothetical protein
MVTAYNNELIRKLGLHRIVGDPELVSTPV